MTKVFESLFWKFIRTVFNFFGLSSFKQGRVGLEVSTFSAIKNLILLVAIVGFAFYRRYFIATELFLPNTHSFDNVTGFSVSIIQIIGDIPVVTAGFVLIMHLKKLKEILNIIKILYNFNASFNLFEDFCKENRKFFLLAFAYLTLSKVSQFILILKPNIWVVITYAVRMFCECNVSLFILTFSMFIKYATFLIANLNSNLREFNERRDQNLSEALSYFQGIEKIMNGFFSVFHVQIGFLIGFMVLNAVLMV